MTIVFSLWNTSINKCTRSLRLQTNKQVENCFLNHNSSIHFCCADSVLMTHRGGLSLSIIIWRIGGGGTSFLFPFPLGPKNSLGGPENLYRWPNWTIAESGVKQQSLVYSFIILKIQLLHHLYVEKENDGVQYFYSSKTKNNQIFSILFINNKFYHIHVLSTK